jgi:hypothetical protein
MSRSAFRFLCRSHDNIQCTHQLQLILQGNELSERVCAIIDAINSAHPPYQKVPVFPLRPTVPLITRNFQLYVIREGDPMEYRFFGHFVEDKTKTLPSYYEFLGSLQRQIQQRGGSK